MDKISIVTVTYNCINDIENTIRSVINQTYSQIEYIIIDGNSTDGTLEIINKYNNQITFWTSEKDNGIFDAMNKGMDHCTGEWVLFMNAGDCFNNNNVLENVFSNQFSSSVGVVYGETILVDQNFNKKHNDVPFYINNTKIKSMGICHQSIFVRTLIAKRIKFDTHLKYSADYNMILKIYKEGYHFIFINVPVSNFKLDGISTNNNISQFREISILYNAYKSIDYYKELVGVVWIYLKIHLKKALHRN